MEKQLERLKHYNNAQCKKHLKTNYRFFIYDEKGAIIKHQRTSFLGSGWMTGSFPYAIQKQVPKLI